MNGLEYATVHFSNGDEYSKDIVNIEPMVTLDTKNGDFTVTVFAELSSDETAFSMTITKERWRKLAIEAEEMIVDMEESIKGSK